MTRLIRTLLPIMVAVPFVMATVGAAVGEPAKLTVQVDKPGHKISPSLYGLFFEEINCAGDGGLYAELVRNRSFEDSGKPEHWVTVPGDTAGVAMSVSTEKPSTASEFNGKSLRIDVRDDGGRVGVANDGYWGMAVNKGDSYKLSLYARCADSFKGGLDVSLESAEGKLYASAKIEKLTSAWKQIEATLTANASDPKARLVIRPTGAGTVWIDVVSLFPAKTWKNRANGLRPDLAGMLDNLSPKFVRFPGGCWVEGGMMRDATRWKKTIGPISDRWTQPNLWGYMSANGLGFHEYLQMCEDLGAEPLFVINCGMSHGEVVPVDKMDEYVQDALDAIEYANGPADSKWGSVRAKAGHPKPFSLKYMEIGNENGGAAYHERWPLFYDAIKAKYPKMNLIANVWGGYPTNRQPDIVDEHYYSTPEFFAGRANMYDSYDRKGPKIYVGEYACTQGCGAGNLRAAIGEAAFMTGMERNSDVVALASYAPLFANVNYKRWNPDMIDFDSSRVYGTPSYYVQQMFAQNKGDVVLPVTISKSVIPAEPTRGAIGVGTWLTQAEYKDILVTKDDKILFKSDFAKGTEGWKLVNGDWSVVDGALRETRITENARAVAGDPKWVDYTITLKARKISGDEGFLVMFRVRDDNSYAWWNIGGWRNSKHGIEWARSGLGKSADGSIETGRWYDIKVEVGRDRVKCYLDGKLIHDEAYPNINSLFATASRDTNGDTILKVVNFSPAPQETELTLAGVKSIGTKAEAIVLTSGDAYDENTLEQPKKVFPKKSVVNIKGTAFEHSFPANSVTVLRFKAK